MASIPAIFLDRDGTLNKDTGYVHRIEDFQFIDGILPTLLKLQNKGFALIIVTNQSGIARGFFTEKDFIVLTNAMRKTLLIHGITLSGIYYCPHHPDGEILPYRKTCDCRKPKPGLLLQAKNALNIDMNASYMVGDKEDDILAGKAAGVGKNILVRTGKPLPKHCNAADIILDSLNDLPAFLTA